MSRPTRKTSHAQEISFRRERVLACLAAGRHLKDVAVELNVNPMTIRRDIRYLTGKAKENIKSFQDKLPFEYMKSIATLDNIKKRAFDIADKEGLGDRDKILALRLAGEIEVSRARLLGEGPQVLAMNTIRERIGKIEDIQFQEKLRQFQPYAR